MATHIIITQWNVIIVMEIIYVIYCLTMEWIGLWELSLFNSEKVIPHTLQHRHNSSIHQTEKSERMTVRLFIVNG